MFDCLSRKVPLIVNAHGSAAELPDETLMKLPDPFTNEALSDALLRLRTNAELRESLSAQGAAYLDRIHHPERIAGLYRDVIEELYATTPQANRCLYTPSPGHQLWHRPQRRTWRQSQQRWRLIVNVSGYRKFCWISQTSYRPTFELASKVQREAS